MKKSTLPPITQKMLDAAVLAIKRKDRDEHPDGNMDNAKRFHPSDSERCSCCEGIRAPSRAFPFSLMVHCRTTEHVFNLSANSRGTIDGMDLKAFKRLIKAIKPVAGFKTTDVVNHLLGSGHPIHSTVTVALL